MKEELEREKGIRVTERTLNISEILNAYHEKRLIEMFGVSPASFVRPISLLTCKNQILELEGEHNYSNYIKDKFLKIFKEGNHPWAVPLEDENILHSPEFTSNDIS